MKALLLTNEWAICPGHSAPHGVTEAFVVSKKSDGAGLTAEALRKVAPSSYVPDAPLGDITLGYGSPALVLTIAQITYFVRFGERRLFLADPQHPDVVIAVYAAF